MDFLYFHSGQTIFELATGAKPLAVFSQSADKQLPTYSIFDTRVVLFQAIHDKWMRNLSGNAKRVRIKCTKEVLRELKIFSNNLDAWKLISCTKSKLLFMTNVVLLLMVSTLQCEPFFAQHLPINITLLRSCRLGSSPNASKGKWRLDKCILDQHCIERR